MKTESQVRRGTAGRRATPPDRGVRSGREAAPERGVPAPDAPARRTRAAAAKPAAKPAAEQRARAAAKPARQAAEPGRAPRRAPAQPANGRVRVASQPRPATRQKPRAAAPAADRARDRASTAATAAPAAPPRPRPERARPARPRPVPQTPAPARSEAPARSVRGGPPRTPFVLLLVGLLCGGLITLLLLNTVLAQDSFRAGELREQNRQIAEQAEKTRNDNARLGSPQNIADGSEAYGDRLDNSPPQFVTPAP